MWRRNKEYTISINEDWVSPEETLLDSGSDHQDLEVPISSSVFKFSFFLSVMVYLMVLGFIFNISIRNYEYFSGISFQNKTVNFSVPPPRGVIFDRLGRPLVSNEPVFDLLVVSKEVKNLSDGDLNKVSNILNRNPDDFKKFLSDGSKSSSVFFAESGLNKNQVLEIKSWNPSGFHIVPNVKRSYVDSSQFSEVIGYVGKVSKNELGLDRYYYPTDIIGRLGIESQYEKYLRGEHGKIFFQASENSSSNNPKIGNSVVLNIDYNMQKWLFNEIFNVLKDTRYSKAAAVVQNPQTGEVLAMISFPSYDNNSFVDGLSNSQFKNLFENKSRPLFNRAISGLYNPGSTIKPLMGLMTLEEKIFSPTDTIKDCVGLTIVNPYNSEDVYTFGNWRVEYGLFNIRRAIANSCNVYFYIAGGGSPAQAGYGTIKGLGVERIANYLKSTLADVKLGIDLPGEESGFVPTPDWKMSARGEGWYQGDTYNISIGQGDLLVTPLWLNSYISAIANGGNIYKPFIAKKILDSTKNEIKNFEPEILTRLNFRDEVIDEIRTAMLETTKTGTARLLGGLPVKSGAKTGTAEVIKGRSINSIMTAFAPFESPEVNISVLIEGSATNEGLAIRATYGFLKWYFEEYRPTLSL